MGCNPLVSVVIATYNRSYVLRHAIGSVLDSSLPDLELIVIGDHCTDDTAEVVAAIRDQRILFINLPERCGDQAGPNNHGLGLARGRIIAFLNQDDLYFVDHLRIGVEQLEHSEADFLWSPTLVAHPISEEALEHRAWRVSIGSTPPAGIYDPLTFCVASSWIFKRGLVKRVGPWRSSSELYVTPSQDWMFRVWRSGAHLVFHPHASVLVVYSGSRKLSYALRSSPEHDVYARYLREPWFREELLEAAAVTQAMDWAKQGGPRLDRRICRKLAAPLRGLCSRLGLHPLSAHFLLRLQRRGDLVKRHRRFVGA